MRIKSSYNFIKNSYASITPSATHTGIVNIESKVEKPQTCDASAVSLLNLAANIAVLVAVGALTKTDATISISPRTPHSQNSRISRMGNARSFKNAVIYTLTSESASFIFAFERYVPSIIIAIGVFIPPMLSIGV